MKKALILILLICILCTLLTGCFDKREVDDLTYVIAMGLDKGEVNNLRLTLQYVVPLATGAGGGGGGGGGGGQSKSVTNVTLECPSLLTGLNLANNFIGKQINLSHAKIAVFSQELAKDRKMMGYINGMIKAREFRPSMIIAVCTSTAKDYLETIKPVQEADPAKYYEIKFSSYKYTGLTINSTLFNFYQSLKSSSEQSAATLVGVSDNDTIKDFKKDATTAAEKGHELTMAGDYLAGNIPKLGDIKGETMGMAVFRGDELAGLLDGREATYYLMVQGKYRQSTFTFKDPKLMSSNIMIDIKQSRKPKVSIKLNNGKPEINLKISLEGDYLAIQSGLNYEEDKERDFMEKSVEDFIKTEVTSFLNKTAKKLRADICAFGLYAQMQFLTQQEWEKYEWLKKYKNTTFNVKVDFKVRRPGLTIRSSPVKGLE